MGIGPNIPGGGAESFGVGRRGGRGAEGGTREPLCPSGSVIVIYKDGVE